MKRNIVQIAVVFLTGLFIGLLVLFQWKSYALVREQVLRDRKKDIFREIQILKSVTDQTRIEIEQTETKIKDLKTKVSTFQTLDQEIRRLKVLSGSIPIKGPGVTIVLPKAAETTWFVDLQNELVNSGAEAISVNKIRIGAGAAGYRFIQPDTLLIGQRISRAPFTIDAIGDATTLLNTLTQPGGLIFHLQKTLGKKEIIIQEKEEIIIPNT